MTRRIRPKPDFAVPRAVEDLLSKFEYPEQRQQVPFDFRGGGGGAPTIVVAASNASDMSKSKADLICAGINDDITINTALAALHSQSIFGGRLLLTEGFYRPRYGQILITSTTGRRVTIQGLGDRSTLLSFRGTSGNGIAYTGAQGEIRDLGITDLGGATGAAIALAAQDLALIDNVRFDNSGVGVLLHGSTSTSRNVQIARCSFLNGGVGVSLTGTGHTHVLIHHNLFRNTGDHPIQSTATAGQGLLIDSNVFNRFSGSSTGDIINISGIYHDVSITNNHMLNAFGSGVVIDADLRNGLIAGNVFDVDDTAIALAHAVRSVIANNQIEANEHGISLSDSSQIEIASNRMWQVGSKTANTFDGIVVSATSDENYIHGNTVLVDPALNPTRYGINISAATCNCNIVVGNRLGDPADYGTDALNDAGTDTQLFYPNDPTYGDNFTACATSPTSP